MKILENQKIQELFLRIGVCMAIFTLLSTVLIGIYREQAIIFALAGYSSMGLAVVWICYGYFKEQNRMLEYAVEQITEYLSGDHTVHMECDEEGEIYRLFHEINSLVDILNAHLKREESIKNFLKNTIFDISHQLKTPLAALNIYHGILEEEAEKSPTIQEFVHLSEQELDRIETLVQNLLKITKFDAGTMVLDQTEEYVQDMMESMKKSFAVRARQEEKQICLSGDARITLVCDRLWLVEAVSNLVKNALDHMQAGGSVWVEWKELSSVVQISVQDNGSGIHPEDLYHIFKRFYRSRFSQDLQGIGLGLPLVKSIVEAHHGTVQVDSALGVGTTFTLNFLIPTKL